jgi:glycosyltransferase involved in cell wall biosynthesis
MTPLRVAMVVPRYLPFVGGLQSHVESLATGLADAGASVTVLTQEVESSLPRWEKVGGIPVRRYTSIVPGGRYPVSPGLGIELRRAASTFDVVHVHSYHGGAALFGLWVPKTVPLVFTPHYHRGGHTPFARFMHRFYGPIGRALVDRADAIIAVSEAEASLLGDDFPGSASRTVVIPNGIRKRPVPSVAEPRPTLLTISRLEGYKRLDLVIEVLHRLPETWRLHVVGKGPEEAAIRHRAEVLGLRERIEITSDLSEEEIGHAIASASVYVSLSEKEAFGMTVLEAASAGIPAVVSDIPAHRELALLAPQSVSVTSAYDPGAAAALILARAGSVSDTSWADNLRWPSVCQQTLSLYETVAGDRTALRLRPKAG